MKYYNKQLFKLVFLTAGFLFLIKIFSGANFIKYFQILNIKLIIFFLFFFISEIFVSLRLKNILNIYPNKITILNIIGINIKSFFLFFVVPGGIGADISRFLNFKRLKSQNQNINFLEIIVFDRLVGISSMFTFLFFSFLFVKEEIIEIFNFDLGDNVNLLFFFLIFIFFLSYFLKNYIKKELFVKRAKHKISNYLDNLALILKSFFFSLITNICLILPIFFISITLEFDIDLIEICFVISASVFLSMIPISLLGVSGLELGSYFLYSILGLESEKAFFLVFSLFLFRFLLASIGGIMELIDAIKKNDFTK